MNYNYAVALRWADGCEAFLSRLSLKAYPSACHSIVPIEPPCLPLFLYACPCRFVSQSCLLLKTVNLDDFLFQ